MDNPRFNRLWLSSGAANLGDGILFAGLPVLATTVTTSPLRIAGVQVAIFLPMLIAALPSGVAADRYDRTRIMTVANLIRAIGLAGLALAASAVVDGQWVLGGVYLAGMLLGLFETLADSGAQTALPMIVPRDRLTRANSLLIGTQTVTNDGVGAPLGGVLAAVGAGWLFAVPAALYAIAGALSSILGRLVPRDRVEERSVRQEVGEGFAFLWNHPALRSLALTNGLSNMGSAAFFGVAVLFFIGPYDLPEAAFGVALAMLAIGGLVGAALGDRIVGVLGHWRIFFIGTLLTGLVYGVLGLSSNVWIAGPALFALGLTGMVWNVSNRVVRQMLTPEPMLGRIVAVMRVTALIASPLGAILGGVISEAFGLRSVVWVTSFTVAVGAILVSRIPRASLQFEDVSQTKEIWGTDH